MTNDSPNEMTNEELVATIRRATEEVFSTMLGLELTEGPVRYEHAALAPSEGVLALIGLAGDWVGTGTISCSADLARRLSGAFLMQEFSAVDEEVLDAIGELSNMIFGNVKTVLEERLGPMGLSIPTVIFGRNFSTRSIGKGPWTVIPFSYDGMEFDVRMCLARSIPAACAHRMTTALSLVE